MEEQSTKANELKTVPLQLPSVTIEQPETVMFLGDKGLCRFEPKTGLLQSIRVNVQLSKKKNQIYEMRGTWKITAEGYEYLNRITGLKIIKEETFNHNGKIYPNPYIIMDAAGKKAQIYTQCTVIGRTPDGQIDTSRAIVHYDAEDAFISEILGDIESFWNSNPKTPEEDSIGFMTTREYFDEDFRPTHKNFKYLTIDEDMGVAINLRKTGIMKSYKTYSEAKKTIDRKVMTICRRNAYRRHPALAFSTVIAKADGGDMIANVVVMSWVTGNEEIEAAIQEYMSDDANNETADVGEYQDESAGFDEDESVTSDIQATADVVEIDPDEVDEVIDTQENEAEEAIRTWIRANQSAEKADGTKISAKDRSAIYGKTHLSEKGLSELESIKLEMIELINGPEVIEETEEAAIEIVKESEGEVDESNKPATK